MKQEIGTAVNIKSKTTRKNVLAALARVEQHLKQYKQTPPNGLCIYSGNISESEGVQDIKLWAFEPPEPLNLRTYRCDQTFVVDHLKDMIEEKEVYGLLTIDASEAAVALLSGKAVTDVRHFDSMVPGKTGKGGQSAQRFERVRRGLLLTFLKQVGEYATHKFGAVKELRGIIIGGPGPIKEQFAEGEFLSKALDSKVLGIKDISYAGEEGLKELVDRSADLLKEAKVMQEKELVSLFLDHLKKDNGLAVYGLEAVEKALESGTAEIVLLSEETPFEVYAYKCRSCGAESRKIFRRGEKPEKCESCRTSVTPEEDDILEFFEELAKQTGAEVKEISADTPEGAQFLQLGGIGAILRYRLDYE